MIALTEEHRQINLEGLREYWMARAAEQLRAVTYEGNRLFTDDAIAAMRWVDGKLTLPKMPTDVVHGSIPWVVAGTALSMIGLRIPTIPDDWDGITPIMEGTVPDLRRSNYCPECTHCNGCF